MISRETQTPHAAAETRKRFRLQASVAYNIGYGTAGTDKPAPDAGAPVDAARDANAHDFFVGFKHGYATHCGARGGQLSRGRKQRGAIARAIVRDPQILLQCSSPRQTRSARTQVRTHARKHACVRARRTRACVLVLGSPSGLAEARRGAEPRLTPK